MWPNALFAKTDNWIYVIEASYLRRLSQIKPLTERSLNIWPGQQDLKECHDHLSKLYFCDEQSVNGPSLL